MTTSSTYHAPVFEPTVDEIAALKQLEMEPALSLPQALHHHLSGRLLEWGFIAKAAPEQFAITDSGRALIRRQDN